MRQFGGDEIGGSTEMARGLALTSSGELYVSGLFRGVSQFAGVTLTSAGAEDAFVAKLSTTGNVLWAKGWGTSESDMSWAVNADAAGNAYRQGDFDEDGDVDGADLTRWRMGFGVGTGASHAQGDANADGTVDGADFLVWQRQLGGVMATTNSSSVPEPAAASLASAAIVWALLGRRPRWAIAPTRRRTGACE